MVYSKVVRVANQSLAASNSIREKAKILRRRLTPSEKMLWNFLRKRQLCGMHFRRQHPYGIYILDFFCFQAALAIEIDGPIHLRKIEYDKERTEYLKSSGLTVLRFNNSDVENRLEWVINKIKSSLRFSPGEVNIKTKG